MVNKKYNSYIWRLKVRQYLDLLEHIKNNGEETSDRTKVGTKSVFGYQMRFNLNDGFPAMTTKKLFMKSVIHELLWFIKGDSNIEYLVKNDVNIWNEWPYKSYLQKTNQPIPDSNSEDWKNGLKQFIDKIKTDHDFALKYGDLGPVYGHQWRHWPDGKGGEIDQIAKTIEILKKTPDSRRVIVSAWNVADIDEMAIAGLPPCHTLFQFKAINGKLSCQLYQRSADTFLGVPFNIASYALLTMMIAQVTGLKAQDFVHTLGDAHIYLNHADQVNEQLGRTPKALPKMIINPNVKNIEDFTFEDFVLEGYNPYPPIKAPIAV